MMRPNAIMSEALKYARLAVSAGEVPVGAVITRDGSILASAHNMTLSWNDPTAHAEVVAIRHACKQIKSPRLSNCDIYVTLEPCAMCAQAIAHARIRRLYYAASDPKGGGVEQGARVFAHATCTHKPEVYGGIGETEAAALLRSFFKGRR